MEYLIELAAKTWKYDYRHTQMRQFSLRYNSQEYQVTRSTNNYAVGIK